MASENLHGNAPDKCAVALLIIDVINDLEFEGGAELLEFARPAVAQIAQLKRRAKAVGVPVVYVNDNFGKWQSDFHKLVTHCLQDGVRGEPLARLVLPEADDYFVLKPKHSGFYSTTLDLLLEHLQSRTLILTGLTGDNCVLFTANDAYLRDYGLVVPPDCVASIEAEANELALQQMRRVLKADVRPAAELELERLKQETC